MSGYSFNVKKPQRKTITSFLLDLKKRVKKTEGNEEECSFRNTPRQGVKRLRGHKENSQECGSRTPVLLNGFVERARGLSNVGRAAGPNICVVVKLG